MPNYTLVNRPVFKARSFDDLVKPFALYKTEYDKVKDQQDKWLDESAKWDVIINMEREKDPTNPLVQSYDAYKESLNQARDALLSGGFNLDTPQLMNKAREGYAKSVPVITEGYENRKKAAEREALAVASDNSLQIANPAANRPISDFVGGNATPSNMISGNQVEQNVAKTIGNLSKVASEEIYGDEWDENKLTGLGISYTYEYAKKYGVKPSDIREYIQNPSNKDISDKVKPFFDAIIKTEVNNPMGLEPVYEYPDNKYDKGNIIGYKSNKGYTGEQISAIQDKAYNGLLAGVGQAQYQTVTDSYGSQSALQQAEFKHQEKMKKDEEKKNWITVNGKPYKYMTSIGWVEVDPNTGNPVTDANGNMNTIDKDPTKKQTTTFYKGQEGLSGKGIIAAGGIPVIWQGMNASQGRKASENYTQHTFVKVIDSKKDDVSNNDSPSKTWVGSVKAPGFTGNFGRDDITIESFKTIEAGQIERITDENEIQRAAAQLKKENKDLYDMMNEDNNYDYYPFIVHPTGKKQNEKLKKSSITVDDFRPVVTSQGTDSLDASGNKVYMNYGTPEDYTPDAHVVWVKYPKN